MPGSPEVPDPSSLVFLIDAASCATPPSVRNAKDPKHRRGVAREHACMVMSTIERLLAHANERTSTDVAWSFQVFDSRLPVDQESRAVPRATNLPSCSSIEDCRKSVQTQFNTACVTPSTPTCNLSSVSAAIIDAVRVARPGPVPPSSIGFVQEWAGVYEQSPSPGNAHSTACVLKTTTAKKSNQARVVVIAAAPQTAHDFSTFFRESSPPSESDDCDDLNSDLEPADRLRVELTENDVLEDALQLMSGKKVQLVWIHAVNRRVEVASSFSVQILNTFREWLVESACVNDLVDMHSLLLDRSIVPFSATASRLLNTMQNKLAGNAKSSEGFIPFDFEGAHSVLLNQNINPFASTTTCLLENTEGHADQDHASFLQWKAVDFLCPADGTTLPSQYFNTRVLRTEISGLLPAQEDSLHYSIACVALVEHPQDDRGLASIGAFDSVPGLVRPIDNRGHRNKNSKEASENWVGAFSGLMVAAAHQGHLIFGSLYRRESSTAPCELEFPIIVQPLTPLSAIVRKVETPAMLGPIPSPLLPSSAKAIHDPNCLRKRIAACACDLPVDAKNELGPRWDISQSARFFEAHLSHDASSMTKPKSSSSSAVFEEALRTATKFAEPKIASKYLEVISSGIRAKDVADLGSTLLNDDTSISEFIRNEDEALPNLVRDLEESHLESDRTSAAIKSEAKISPRPESACPALDSGSKWATPKHDGTPATSKPQEDSGPAFDSQNEVPLEEPFDPTAHWRRIVENELTPSSAAVEVLPPIHRKSPIERKRRSKDLNRRESISKRPRTSDMIRVLAEAAASRGHAVDLRNGSGPGLSSLSRERRIQRPLVAKSKDAQTTQNRPPRHRTLARRRASSPEKPENEGNEPNRVWGVPTTEVCKFGFYSEPTEDQFLVPETPSDCEVGGVD